MDAGAVTMGSIPAWAGEPRHHAIVTRPARVDPRVGGGAAERFVHSRPGEGRSPRGRGSRVRQGLEPGTKGSIPAWAGEPYRITPTGGDTRVDPRVGGGAGDRVAQACALEGRSPRGRGSHDRRAVEANPDGSIPAWAGEPTIASSARDQGAVDPRVGGGAPRVPLRLVGRRGRSPRGRGSRVRQGGGVAAQGSIPAWAGEPAQARPSSLTAGVDPRVGGGAKMFGRADERQEGRSPRGRGSPLGDEPVPTRVRSIPAWAGEPRTDASGLRHDEVDPRVGGGAAMLTAAEFYEAGRSPRGRGSLR